ncbi:MAG: WD40 repeat domain-containing protein [Sphingomonadales bacterium]|nr:WD40 repeat domain-containing protein [Sphingomonadales bacterium]
MQHVGPIAGVVAHESWVATAGYDNRLILWDAQAGIALARANHDHLVNACAFSHDGRRLVSAGSDGTARVWTLPGLKLEAVLAEHGDDVDMACFSPDDALIATCALDRLVRVFDARGRCLHALAGHTGNVLSLAWIDSRRFLTTSVDGTVREWDARDGTALRVTALGMRCDSAVVGTDGTILAGDDRGRIAVIAADAAPEFIAAHAAGVKKLVLASDGSRLVSLGYDRAIAVWRIDAHGLPVEIGRSELPPQIWARAASVCVDGRIAVGTFGGTYALFDPDSGDWDLAGVEAGDAINAVAEHDGALWTIGDAGVLRRDGESIGGPGSLCNFLVALEGRLLAGGHLGQLVDAVSGQRLYQHHSPLNCATAFARGGVPHLAVGTYTGEILVFAQAGGPLRHVHTLAAHANAVKGLAFGDGTLFSVSANTDIAWHAVGDWHEQRRIPRAHDRIANACCALPGGCFASVGRDRMLRLWLTDAETAWPTPHPNSVKCMATSPCGRWIASGSYGGTVVVFDRALNAFLPMRRLSKAGISALCWSTRAQGFVATSYAGERLDVPPAPAAIVLERAAA